MTRDKRITILKQADLLHKNLKEFQKNVNME